MMNVSTNEVFLLQGWKIKDNFARAASILEQSTKQHRQQIFLFFAVVKDQFRRLKIKAG